MNKLFKEIANFFIQIIVVIVVALIIYYAMRLSWLGWSVNHPGAPWWGYFLHG